MKTIVRTIWVASCGLVAAAAFAQQVPAEDAVEPAELARLREQFSNRIEREMEPWRKKYQQELERLEQRLIQERRLVDALAVRREKEKATPLGDPAAPPRKPENNPKSAEELAKAVEGTLWIAYGEGDKTRSKMLDVYHFRAGGVFANLLHPNDPAKWEARSANRVLVTHKLGQFEFRFDLNSRAGVVSYSFQQSKGECFYAGKYPPAEGGRE